MLNLIRRGGPAQVEPLFSAAHTSDARRAQAWLEAQFRRAEKTGGFTLDDVEITPVMAEVILTCNTHNRPITPSHVSKLERAITDGRWISGARTIRFDVNRVLADGQHTSTAIIQAGRSAVVDVRFGIPAEARDVIDSGRVRRGGDIVGLHGYADANNLAAAARLLRNVQVGTMTGNGKIDNDECVEFVRTHPGLIDAVKVGHRVYGTIRVGVAPASVAYYLIAASGAPSSTAEDFFDTVRTGLGLNKRNDPRYVLREFLVKGSYRGSVGYRSAQAILAAFILAWNAHKNGRRIWSVEIERGDALPNVEDW